MQSDINVWMIDYKDVCAGPRECYLAAVYNLPAVGKCAALFVRKIIELSEVEVPEEAMHVIGFSLRGQLASQLAKHLKPIKLPRITGELQHIIITIATILIIHSCYNRVSCT